MEWLQQLAHTVNIPLLTALILGIMTAISPCPLAMNITATAYLSRDIANKQQVMLNGLAYTVGRMVSYTTLAALIFFGASKLHVAQWLQQVDGFWIGIALVAIGILMFDFIKFDIPLIGKVTASIGKKNIKRNSLNAFLLGLLFALAFCPYSAVIYFGGLIPLTLASTEGLLLPLVFAFATGLPVIIIAWLLAYSVANIGTFYNKTKLFEKWFKRLVAAVFIVAGAYYVATNI